MRKVKGSSLKWGKYACKTVWIKTSKFEIQFHGEKDVYREIRGED